MITLCVIITSLAMNKFMFPIPNIIFVVLLAIATGYLTFLTTKGGLTDNRFSSLWKKITKRGKLVLATLFTICLFLALQEYNSQLKNDMKESYIERKDRDRDSVIAARVKVATDSSRLKLYEDISIAFKKQSLRLDTVAKELHVIKDSVKGTVILTENKRPTIEICPQGPIIEVRDNKKLLVIPYCSYDAWARAIDMNTYIIIIDTLNKLHFGQKRQTPANGHDLTETKAALTEVELGDLNLELVKGFYIYLAGTYTDKNLKKIYPADVAYYFGIHSNNFSYTTGKLRNEMIDFLKRNKHL